MATVSKSVRVKDYVMELVEEYSAVEKDVFGCDVNFSELVNDALCIAIYERVKSLPNAMKDGEIIVIKNGKRGKIEFEKDKIEAVKELYENAEACYLSAVFD